MITKLLPNERLDDLQIKGYEIIQSPGRFCFGMDAVLLSAFARVKKNSSDTSGGKISGTALYGTGDPGRECRYGKAQCQL